MACTCKKNNDIDVILMIINNNYIRNMVIVEPDMNPLMNTVN